MDFQFPEQFLWGAATAAHQVEGNNVNSESWVLEHLPGTIYAEPSGDACDHYHRYPADIALLADLGFKAYRFSIEWSRVEPEEGEFSYASLEHYRRMLAACHEHGITPVVTYHHFTSPRWLLRYGGWLDAKTPERFARYCERVTRHVGDLFNIGCTLNEPNIAVLLSKILPFNPASGDWWTAAAQAFGVSTDRLGVFQFVASPEAREVMLAAHRQGYDAIKAVRGDISLGLTLALPDIQQTAGGEQRAAEFRRDLADTYLERLHQDDFVGVQNYGRMVVGPDGLVPPSADVEKNQMGEEFYPEGLEGAVRYAAQVAGIPVYVTENGLSSTDDSRRVEYFRRALESIANCLHSGVDVRGYFAWSAFDNFEWVSGYRPRFGIIAVDRDTQERTPKPSAHWLGAVARVNRLQG